jgi:hypothetical protein
MDAPVKEASSVPEWKVQDNHPITFFSSLVVPLTPPSLVKFSRNASGVITGESSSAPTNDHVPELRNAVPSRADIAATAEPVS